MLVSSVTQPPHVHQVAPLGLPPTAARVPGPARLLSVLFESRWSPKRNVSRKELRNHLLSMADSHQEEVADDLEPLGWGVISWLRRFGVKVRVCDADELASPHGPLWGGLYRPRFRAITLREGWDQSTALHEMAHALDHSLASVCRHRGGNSPTIAPMLWHGFASQREDFVSDYAATNPKEYFAESFAAMFFEDDNRHLASIDPGMHAFLGAIVDLSNIF